MDAPPSPASDEPVPATDEPVPLRRAGEPPPPPPPISDPEDVEGSRLEAAPGLARIAAAAWLRTVTWTAESTLRAGARMSRALIDGESPATLIREAGEEAVVLARRLLGADEAETERIQATNAPAREEGDPLRRRGAALLEASADLAEHADEHPAYARILEQISPDEARILRLLATEGPQPAVDVRTWRPLDIGSRVTAPGLTMIGQHAGVMHHDRVPAYLSNLFRLGLIWFSRDQLPDPGPYQVLEAQPEVIDAIRRTGRARIVRRSINLTPFGRHFCDYCLPLRPGAITAEFEALEAEPVELGREPGTPPALG